MISENKLYKILSELNISYKKTEHPPIFTAEEGNKYWKNNSGEKCKNLFLRNKKGNIHYLVVLEASKVLNIKKLSKILDNDRLSFASAERLMKHLGLTAGSVSPFGLINNSDKKVIVLIDKDLSEAQELNFHPNINTATLTIKTSDLMKFLEFCGNEIRIMEF